MSEIKLSKKGKKNSSKDEPLLLRALLDIASFNIEANTVDVTWATEAPGRRVDVETDEIFNEVLSFDLAHVRLDRLRAGGPVLNNHQRSGDISQVQIGVIENVAVVNREGRATLRLSKNENVKPIVENIKDGIIRNVSCGYRVYLYRDITRPGDSMRTLMAVDWEPTEISFTPVPFDYKACVRGLSLEKSAVNMEPVVAPVVVDTNKNEINKTRSDNMKVETDEEKTTREALEQTRSEGVLGERTRVKEIGEAVRSAGLDEALITEYIESGTAIDKVRALVIEKFAEQQKNPIRGVSTAAVTGADADKLEKTRAVEEIVSIRAFGVASLGTAGPVTERGKSAANGRRVHLLELARNYVEMSGVSGVGSMPDNDVLTRAMASTDFPVALANVADKQLRKRFAVIEPAWKKFATRDDAPDFKPRHSVMVDGDFVPERLTEGGEYTEAVLKETGDEWSIDTYGKKVSLTRKMIINDDLSAFTKLIPFFANGMAEMQNRVVMQLIAGNGRTLSDGKTLFHADHGNIASVGSIMSEASFTDGTVAMQLQKTLAGSLMASQPVYLWIPPQLLTAAKKLIHSTITATKTGDTNVFQGMFEIVNDPYLQANPTTWYLLADPNATEIFKYGELAGQGGIYTEQRWNFDNDALEVKFRNDFGATIEEHRGIYKNAGA